MSRISSTLPFCVLSLALLVAACGDDGEAPDSGAAPDAAGSTDASAPDARVDAGTLDFGPTDADAPDLGTPDAGPLDSGVVEGDPACDSIMPGVCALPWPSNLCLEADGTRATGYTLAFGATSLPRNNANPPAHIQGAAYRELDGYGLATPILMHFPNVDGSGRPNEL